MAGKKLDDFNLWTTSDRINSDVATGTAISIIVTLLLLQRAPMATVSPLADNETEEPELSQPSFHAAPMATVKYTVTSKIVH